MKIIAVPSPHFSDRQDKIQFIILHASGTENLEETFSYLIDSKPPNRVSAHYVIDRDGTVYALVAEDKTAWHAGLSDFENYAADRGVKSLNDSSIGIELQTPALSKDPKTGEVVTFGEFTPAQFDTCVELCARLMKRYQICAKHVLRHSDVAVNRKFDVGAGFPWDKFKKQLDR